MIDFLHLLLCLLLYHIMQILEKSYSTSNILLQDAALDFPHSSPYINYPKLLYFQV